MTTASLAGPEREDHNAPDLFGRPPVALADSRTGPRPGYPVRRYQTHEGPPRKRGALMFVLSLLPCTNPCPATPPMSGKVCRRLRGRLTLLGLPLYLFLVADKSALVALFEVIDVEVVGFVHAPDGLVGFGRGREASDLGIELVHALPLSPDDPGELEMLKGQPHC